LRWDKSLNLRPFLASLGFPVYAHKLDLLASSYNSTPSRSEQLILDLSPGISLLEESSRPVELLGYPFNVSSLVSNRVEAWTIADKTSYSQCQEFRLHQQWQILEQLRQPRPLQTIDAKCIILKHYNSHFGHFVAEILGQLIWCADLMGSNSSFSETELVVIAPAPTWQEFLQLLYPTIKFRFFVPTDIISDTLRFTRALISPRLSSWQALAIARNTITCYIKKNKQTTERRISYSESLNKSKGSLLFLSSAPPYSRIHNFEEILECLQSLGFKHINPLGLKILDLLTLLNQADYVISEQGSIYFNCLLSRYGRTLLLTSRIPSDVPPAVFFCRGGLYNEFGRGAFKELICEPVSYDYTEHPYSQRIHVDLDALSTAVARDLL
jgi:capsular polysaccharide biosynthesis protein